MLFILIYFTWNVQQLLRRLCCCHCYFVNSISIWMKFIWLLWRKKCLILFSRFFGALGLTHFFFFRFSVSFWGRSRENCSRADIFSRAFCVPKIHTLYLHIDNITKYVIQDKNNTCTNNEFLTNKNIRHLSNYIFQKQFNSVGPYLIIIIMGRLYHLYNFLVIVHWNWI